MTAINIYDVLADVEYDVLKDSEQCLSEIENITEIQIKMHYINNFVIFKSIKMFTIYYWLIVPTMNFMVNL